MYIYIYICIYVYIYIFTFLGIFLSFKIIPIVVCNFCPSVRPSVALALLSLGRQNNRQMLLL